MEIIFGILVLAVSVIIHEVAHGYAAELQGDPTARLAGRLTLNPIKHIDPMGSIILPLFLALANSGFIIGWAKPVPFNPYNLKFQRWGEALVAIAGPASNMVLAIAFGTILRFHEALALSTAFIDLSVTIVVINIVLTVFNLVPIPPLDGSKILFAFIPQQADRIREIMERYWFVGILILLFVLWPFIEPIILWLFTLLTGLAL